MKKGLLKQIIRDFHTTPLPTLRRRALQVPTGTGKIITLDSSEAFELNGINISVVPLYRWLLC
jgi:hypothetical protein